MIKLVKIYFRTFKEIWNASRTFFVWFILLSIFSTVAPFLRLELTRAITVALTEQYQMSKFIGYVTVFVMLILAFEILFAWVRKKFALSQENGKVILQIQLAQKSCKLNYEDITSESVLNQKALAEQVMDQFGQILDGINKILSNFTILATITVVITRVNYIVILAAGFGIIVNALASKVNAAAEFRRMRRNAPVLRKLNYFYDVFENFKYAKDIRGYQMQKRFEPHLNEIRIEDQRLTKEFFRASRWQGLLAAIAGALLSCAVYFVLGYQLLVTGEINYPDFVYLSGLVLSFNMSISTIVEAFTEYKENASALESYFDYKDLPTRYTQENKEGSERLPLKTIDFNHVTFRYPGSDEDVLKDISLQIVPGRKYAIVGENGAGKSTFVKLLLRMYLPASGEILLNRMNIAEISEEVYQSYFAAVFQDYSLFAMSLEDNITLFHENSQFDAVSVAENAGLADKLKELPQGINTNLFRIFDENGIELSGGEGQKLAIARALYRNSEILVLDEPTAALDAIAENKLYSMINDNTTSKTVFFVSHRLATTKFCDEILVFEGGRIVQIGSHEALMKQPGLYKELFEMQASAYRADPINAGG